MANSDAARRNLSLQFNRLIPAPCNLIFEAFTDPDLLKSWIAPGNMTFTRLVPGSQLEYTWAGNSDPAEESHVTVSLYESPRGTTLTLDHEGFQSEQSLHNHHSAWQSSLTKLRDLFSVN
jgi:uncharacterized protein YndB with AHSA1/START domain